MRKEAVSQRGRGHGWSIADEYKTYTQVPYRVIMAESLAWTLPGLLYPKRSGHPRGRLMAFAALNCLSLAAANRKLKNNPELLEDDGWLLAQTAAAWLRYAGYGAVIPKNTYWRGPRDNVAFYTQAWWPILLWGAGRGPKAAAAAGIACGYLFYLSSAWANGEALVPPSEVRRNIENYANTAWRSGIVCAVVFRALQRASQEALIAREALAVRLAAEEEERSIRRQEAAVRNDVTLSLMRIKSLGRELLPPELGDEIAANIDEALGKPWNHGDTSRGSTFGIIDQATQEFAQAVKVGGRDVQLDVISTGAFQAVIYTALDNVRVHAQCTEVLVETDHVSGRLELRISDNGVGLCDAEARYPENHALTRAREYVQYLGGDMSVSENFPRGVTVDAWWPHPQR
jgi:anti-sigma regulatory factor (Ser/Thr protein kinase)